MKRMLVLVLFGVMLSACNSVGNNALETQVSAAVVKKPEDLSGPVQPEGLYAIKQKLSGHWKEIEEKNSVKIQMAGVGKDHITIQIRSSGDVERAVSDAEIEAVKKTLFDIAGSEFPLQLSVWKCCSREADVTGKITAFDKEQNRVLIVNEQKKNGNSGNPEATWIGLSADGILLVGGSKESAEFDKALIGRAVKAWSTGVMLQSYPGQTSAVKVVVE